MFFWLQPHPAWAQSPQAIHQVSFPNRHNQYVDVSLRMPVSQNAVEFAMPAWTPGSYQIRDYASHVENLRAQGSGGRSLRVHKTAKNRWLVETGGAAEVTVDYSVWAGELAVNSSWVESAYALLNGASLFLYTAESRGWQQSVLFHLPPDWKRTHTSMSSAGAEHEYQAHDFDELIDSPTLLGNAPDFRFTTGGQEYILVNQDESGLWNGRKAADDLRRMVDSVQAFWGTNPLDRPYVFLNVIAEGMGGLEHDNSTVLISGAWQMRYRDEYVRWLALAAHEFFHVWNVRRMRPQGLVPYDYEREAYTRELWLSEGFKSYYDNLLLLRSGLITVDEYLGLLADEFHSYETMPGRKVRSAELASFDAWIKHYRPDANTINASVSYYRKGSLIGFVLDTAVRRKTDHEQSLDTLMRDMYARYGKGGSEAGPYPPGTFERLLETVAGPELRIFAEQMLTSTQDPEIDAALDWYGLKLDRAPMRTAAQLAGRPAPADFGVTWDKDTAGLVVEAVLRGSSGAAAGILPADELLAIDNTRVTRENIADRMLRLTPGENVSLLLARHGRLLTVPVTTQDAIPDKYQISLSPDLNRKQKERMMSWLGIPLRFGVD